MHASLSQREFKLVEELAAASAESFKDVADKFIKIKEKYAKYADFIEKRSNTMFSPYEIFAYDQEDGDIILKPKVITATSEQVARDTAVLKLGDKGYTAQELSEISVVVRPLG